MNPPKLNPLIVGEWDGVHIWLQWDGREGRQYRVRLRYREPGAAKAAGWVALGPILGDCAKVPAHKLGWAVEAQVAEAGGRKLNWEKATTARFGRSRCRFEFASSGRKVTFTKGQTIHCVIGGEPCSYRVMADFEVAAEGRRKETLEAVRSAPGNRLRAAGQFRIAPAFDLVIRNAGPSENDLIRAGGVARIAYTKPDGPMTVAFHPLPRRVP